MVKAVVDDHGNHELPYLAMAMVEHSWLWSTMSTDLANQSHPLITWQSYNMHACGKMETLSTIL